MTDFENLCINTIRLLAVDGVEKAKSGHPGMPMGSAAMAYTLWMQHLKHNPLKPHWQNRDRFILSAGHGSMLIYSLLHLTGYELTLDDLKNFRQWESITPGHPEYKLVPGVETTTGPLGQGFATGVGMAIAQKYLAVLYNRPPYNVIDYLIYGIVSDGDLMEGVASEAASLAGHLKLGNIIYLYDDNKISIEGSTTLAFTEDVAKRFEAYGWYVQTIENGNDIDAIDNAITAAKKETERPSLIKVRTHIGFGSPNKQDKASSHGAPLGAEEVKLTKKNLGWDPEKQFFIPEDVLAHFRKSVEKGIELETRWNDIFALYCVTYPELATELVKMRSGKLGESWKKALPVFTTENGSIASRAASAKVINAIAPHLPGLFGGSADLAESNLTDIKGGGDFLADQYDKRNLHFGVREHAMSAVLNGMALTDGIIPYGGTFLVFADYMRPSIRLAAMMGTRTIYVFTHDSIGLGEDGPTHQPVEQIASLRAIPNLTLIRPADANEVSVAWKVAIENKNGPVALILSRQKLPFIDRTKFASAEHLEKGAYILAENSSMPELILIASGSEVQLIIGAFEQLANENIGIRIVNMPSWELFEKQSKEYRESVLPSSVRKRLVVETGCTMGWERYSGTDGIIIGLNRFGASAPYEVLMKEFGFTVKNVVQKAKSLIK
jgi:transketolase